MTTIAIERWGKDHWSTLLYVETRIVDHGGSLSADRMRCIRDRHPDAYLAKRHTTAFFPDEADATRYPTRLRDGEKVFDHDDYDCLADMIDEGVIVELAAVLLHRHSDPEDASDPRSVWRLTPRGEQIVGALRAHRGHGGNLRDFEIEKLVSS